MRAFLGLGSNLGDRQKMIEAAEFHLNQEDGIRVVNRSSLYESDPWGKTDQPVFLNRAIEIDTQLDPKKLLQIIQQIENNLGRQRQEHWGPRTIDIDILLFSLQTIDLPDLQIPHPEISGRRFVLEPLAEIALKQIVPGFQQTVEILLQQCSDTGRVQLFQK
ncbi:2-amino-4-hydroxy-6-hydroxymethyldihydropteridine diphosphokinase [candidate division KSB1 bacterium]|nr:2-amino-4-hydroxy-6-hydroxymethyldihydropteridine diphosphokinase [candidate division KSB1 bacterium]